jgi:hypothetical protein
MSEHKGWFITPEGKRTFLPDPANEDGTFSLRQLQDAVGGYIEVVSEAKGKVVLVDEEGLVKGLPINIAGSLICDRPIRGNVVVIDEECWS